MRECIATAHAHSKTVEAMAAHLKLRPAARSCGVTLTEGGGEAAQLQVGAAAREDQELGFGFGFYRAEYHQHVVVSTEALQ